MIPGAASRCTYKGIAELVPLLDNKQAIVKFYLGPRAQKTRLLAPAPRMHYVAIEITLSRINVLSSKAVCIL